MINPVTQILMIKRAELNADLAHHEIQFRRGKISFEEYNEKTKELIRVFYSKYSSEDVYRDSEPKGLVGLVMKLVRKLFQKSMPTSKEYKMDYSVGDLVKVQVHPYDMVFNNEKRDKHMYGLVVGRTSSWWQAFKQEQARSDMYADGKTRYWDSVNYAPYHVMLVGKERSMEWVSPEYMELVS